MATDATILERMRFGGVNLFVSGSRTQAQVELRWRGLPRLGSASGWSTRASAHRLIAQATLAAVQEFLEQELAIAVQDVAFLRLGKRPGGGGIAFLLIERREQLLIGSCVVEQDLQQAVVCATLAALEPAGGDPATQAAHRVCFETDICNVGGSGAKSKSVATHRTGSPTRYGITNAEGGGSPWTSR